MPAMPPNQVSIVGAGIAGLVLGRCLLRHGIRAVLYERDAAKPRHSYGITLRSSAYRLLLPILGTDESTFIRRLAVDGLVGGSGREATSTSTTSFRANRQKFEELLREGLDVRWEHKLKDLRYSDEGHSTSLHFENGEAAETQLLVSADGVHSQVRRIVSPTTEFHFLPFAVYNGKRRLKPSEFDQTYDPYMNDTTTLSTRTSHALLQLSVHDRTEDKVTVGYTYSRPARQQQQEGTDPLYRPNRPITGATDMPSELYEEIDSLRSGLEEPHAEVFTSEKMKDDRLLNWLMRSVLIPQGDLDGAAQRGIVFLGDSAHHGPILGSEGANEAIEDAVDLAEFIASGRDLEQYHTQRYSGWSRSVQEGEARLAEMHGAAKSSL